MKCYQHLDQSIVAQCQTCSRGLCSDCADRFQSSTCQNCAKEQNREYRNGLVRRLALSAGIFFLVFTSVAGDQKANHPFVFSFFMAYMAASIPWGWAILNRISPNVFLILPLIGWLIYFGFKLYLSALVGIFVAPFKIYRAVQEIRELGQQPVQL